MNIRNTGQTQIASALANLQKQQTDIATYQNQITSGLRVVQASDDPAAYAAIADAKASSVRFGVYTANISTATTDLNAGVSALTDVNDVLVRAKQIAQQGVDPTNDATSREALAAEVDSLIDRTVRAANSQADGKYIFGGTATDKPPFAVTAATAGGQPTAVTYSGATDRASGLISTSQSVETKYVGSAVFQASGGDAFAALISLRDTLRNTSLTDTQRSAALAQSVGTVDAARTSIGITVGEQSAALAGLEAIGNRVSDLKLSADTRAGDLQSADFAQAVLKMTQQETAFQATLSISARLFQTSLLDFIN